MCQEGVAKHTHLGIHNKWEGVQGFQGYNRKLSD
ncbi:hypothetical protein TOT_030000380 [Theileria orientalis strain Shintoku]|uniref:Uncharacterized protein n=1 Tax=Theileria orientalis strain Shintoku TaxID=869250 RepID=J4CDG8_THEOR|nr:hypothetical protein TOT_030000380 [Theileria orientalis strain Shintoku]PVC54348.1 hypothetical protein MACL_00003124 [Theileria orientalis]BAM41117.1 hypothetical protein TOT_030000380 [Theileria orientalis strain Shintoku]|eukprot:XP_009691418.1 hypothetical protein TOT_030000380 [Theileria orientalis strain Shintoku]